MKKRLLAVSLFLFSFNSFCQNWSVINSVDRFNYRLDNDPVITSTIWSDSVSINGSDSVFLLNKIMCDTCVTVIGGPNPCDTCYAARNHPQFFQRDAIVSVSGIVNFRDVGNLVINTLASLNDSWIFDSIQNISAIVIAVTMDSVLGSYDSLKTILLSNGDSIKLSENFGLIQFPNGYGNNSYFRLVGIEGRNLGEQIPKFADIFNFDIGDMFEYLKTGWSSECFINESRKYSIISKQVNADSVVYGIQGIIRHYHWPLGFWTVCDTTLTITNFTSTLIYWDSLDHFTNKYNRESFNLSNHLQYCFEFPYSYYHAIPCGNNDSAYDRVNVYRDSNLVISKSFGIAYETLMGNDYYYHYTEYNKTDTLYIDHYQGQNDFAFTSTYKAGLGLTDYVLSGCFESIDIDHMIAYRKGNDTVGVFTPDSILLLSLDNPQVRDRILISPNPASSTIHILFPVRAQTEIYLTDIQGKILWHETVLGISNEINVSNIESGLYFVLIKTTRGTFSKKIIILH